MTIGHRKVLDPRCPVAYVPPHAPPPLLSRRGVRDFLNEPSGRAPVVGAAIIRRGRVLAARRTAPPVATGRWELPGGKVEAGETPESAVVREVREELGVDIVVTGWLTGRTPVGDVHELSVALAELIAGEPRPGEHDRLRWLGADELHDVDWLEPDRPFLPELGRRLTP